MRKTVLYLEGKKDPYCPCERTQVHHGEHMEFLITLQPDSVVYRINSCNYDLAILN